MDKVDFYYMRVSATHQELALVADRMGRLAILGRGNMEDPTFELLEKRRGELNQALQSLQAEIESF